jgi:hypothetical protein
MLGHILCSFYFFSPDYRYVGATPLVWPLLAIFQRQVTG